MKKKISVVIPTYNEEANVVPLAKAVSEVMERDLSEYDYEILFIDNHSKQSSTPRISDRHVLRSME